MAGIRSKEEDRSYEIKVNGIEIEVKRQKITAGEILALAKERGAVPGKPEEYVLQGDKGRYDSDDLIDLNEDYIFITLPTAPTQVA
ncbi:MAG: hypothetical protein OXF54_22915 [Caldilineaceae bacterium]|nr:hypothetical protein [Caldilineaceae bacterium]